MLRDGAEMSDIYLREAAAHLQQLYAAAMTVRFLEQQLLPRIMDAEDAWVDPDVNLEVLRVFDQDPNDVAANLPEMVVAPNTSNVIHEDVEEGNVVALLKPGFEDQMLVVRKRNGSTTAGRNYLHTRRQNPMTREPVDPMGLSYRRVTVR
jgi:hypothetical protein